MSFMVFRIATGSRANHSCLVFSFHFPEFTFHHVDNFISCWIDPSKRTVGSWNSDKITGRRSAFVTRWKRKKKGTIEKEKQREIFVKPRNVAREERKDEAFSCVETHLWKTRSFVALSCTGLVEIFNLTLHALSPLSGPIRCSYNKQRLGN